MQMCREGGEEEGGSGALRTLWWGQGQGQPGLRQRGGMMGQSTNRSQRGCCPGRARPTGRAQDRLVSSPLLGRLPSLHKQFSRL